MAERRVVELAVAETYDLRVRVLRDGTPSSEVEWAGDEHDSTIHLGVVDQAGAPIAISTWIRATSPDLAGSESIGYQLRGMATDPSPAVRGSGAGSLLLAAGIEMVRQRNGDHIWANARTVVLGFYTSAGFVAMGDEFTSAETAIPHRRILLRLD